MKLFPDISFVVDNNLCFSCGACNIVCHPNSISFHLTPAGRLHPKIDYGTCTHCGVCYAVCPGYDTNNRVLENVSSNPFEGNVLKSFFGRTLNEKIFKNSQSGGLATEVLLYLFEQKLITHALVVKSDFSANSRPSYILANDINEIYYSQKSKYTPIDLLSTLQNIKEIEGDIAVVGLPCHIEGVVSLLIQNPRRYKKNINLD